MHTALAWCFVQDNLIGLPTSGCLADWLPSAPAQNGVVFGNGKAANAGGVAVSGLEMSQNRIGERRMLFAWLFAAERAAAVLVATASARPTHAASTACCCRPAVEPGGGGGLPACSLLTNRYQPISFIHYAGLQWSREEVEAKLTDIMNTIYRTAKVIGFREDRLNFDCLQRCTMNTIYRTAKVRWNVD